jgi:hypothetical protein
VWSTCQRARLLTQAHRPYQALMLARPQERRMIRVAAQQTRPTQIRRRSLLSYARRITQTASRSRVSALQPATKNARRRLVTSKHHASTCASTNAWQVSALSPSAEAHRQGAQHPNCSQVVVRGQRLPRPRSACLGCKRMLSYSWTEAVGAHQHASLSADK